MHVFQAKNGCKRGYNINRINRLRGCKSTRRTPGNQMGKQPAGRRKFLREKGWEDGEKGWLEYPGKVFGRPVERAASFRNPG
jgi:hypothetical protein